MYRLGLQLTLRSGREGLVRLLVTAGAVAIGVAIMLGVLADFHAFQVTNNRPSWESTQAVGSSPASTTHSELWNYSDDIYQGQTIERLDVAALGPDAPVPPGISHLPRSGQYYASPALAALVRSAPANELGDRFPGRLAGTISPQALTGPTELVIYVGYAKDKLAALPATVVVDRIATAPGKQIWSHYFRDAFVVAAVAFLFPILILVGTATRLAAARREERYAALRLVGATSGQVGVMSSVDAIVSAVLGAMVGVVIFLALQPALAGTAITSARYFAADVTPTITGYLVVLVGVPLASAVSSLLSLRRVRISPLGVARRVTPVAPAVWRIVPLLLGIALFVYGLQKTNQQSIGGPALPGLIIILIGLVVAGPWLTARAARAFGSVTTGASSLLAARRLADNPRAAFRSVRGLVLAVFLGTVVAGLLPAIESITATPSATALSSVLLDGFTTAPVCGNTVNCSGNTGNMGNSQPGSEGATASQQLIAQYGLPPSDAAALLRGLSTFAGATAVPIYSLPLPGSSKTVKPKKGSSKPGGGSSGSAGTGPSGASGPGTAGPGGPGGPGDGVIGCTGLKALVALGQCAPGRTNVIVPAANLFSDNPRYSTQPIASSSSAAGPSSTHGLYLQAVLVKVNSAATLERIRTYLVAHTPLTASGAAPRTFGEAVQARQGVAATVQRLVYIAVALTLIVAGCSLAVAVGGSLVERKRAFTLLRLTGTPTSTLYRVVLLEAVLPLVSATVVAAGVAYGISVLTVSKMAPVGTPTPVPGHAYFLTMGIGLAASLLIIMASLPLLRRITGQGSVRFE